MTTRSRRQPWASPKLACLALEEFLLRSRCTLRVRRETRQDTAGSSRNATENLGGDLGSLWSPKPNSKVRFFGLLQSATTNGMDPRFIRAWAKVRFLALRQIRNGTVAQWESIRFAPERRGFDSLPLHHCRGSSMAEQLGAIQEMRVQISSSALWPLRASACSGLQSPMCRERYPERLP